MMNSDIVSKLRERYSHIHPLIFHRSVEQAKTPGELFDILDEFSDSYPIIWDEQTRRWKKTRDVYQYKKLSLKGN